ncbi:MarR family transcriptional regulator [Halapricum sp. CBA1109]|uniref:helix-turn-helix domain-containing protein n=1 Tax=Halapricum sp. CBA1109 TaxID=2668068 RepID=UPI0012F96440|nr:helix-turn-helix domain-containing protein [Halapricum sp. CBA1109]MUV90685.1 MarR family transcriptional regulator [Halapricum sp. CBA1109]
MPIHLDSDNDTSPAVTPGTNEHELFDALAAHPDLGFTPKELSELTAVPHNSIYKTLSRLREKGLVRNVDGYWAVADDVAGSRAANVVSLASIKDQYGDDAYGDDDEWAQSATDLGENA